MELTRGPSPCPESCEGVGERLLPVQHPQLNAASEDRRPGLDRSSVCRQVMGSGDQIAVPLRDVT